MSKFCIYCECEPVDEEGWVKSKDPRFLLAQEDVCPWCIKEGKI